MRFSINSYHTEWEIPILLSPARYEGIAVKPFQTESWQRRCSSCHDSRIPPGHNFHDRAYRQVEQHRIQPTAKAKLETQEKAQTWWELATTPPIWSRVHLCHDSSNRLFLRCSTVGSDRKTSEFSWSWKRWLITRRRHGRIQAPSKGTCIKWRCQILFRYRDWMDAVPMLRLFSSLHVDDTPLFCHVGSDAEVARC